MKNDYPNSRSNVVSSFLGILPAVHNFREPWAYVFSPTERTGPSGDWSASSTSSGSIIGCQPRQSTILGYFYPFIEGLTDPKPRQCTSTYWPLEESPLVLIQIHSKKRFALGSRELIQSVGLRSGTWVEKVTSRAAGAQYRKIAIPGWIRYVPGHGGRGGGGSASRSSYGVFNFMLV